MRSAQCAWGGVDVSIARASFRRSTGLLVARLGVDSVVYDPLEEAAHVVGPLGTWILESDHETAVEDIVDDAVAVTGVRRPDVEAEIVATVEVLRSKGLLDRQEAPPTAPAPWPGSGLPDTGRPLGVVHAAVDHRIAFRSSSPDLLQAVDGVLGDGVAEAPTTILDIEREPDGGVTVTAADVWPFPDLGACLRQVVTVVNEYAARSDDTLVLHAGAVRTPDGRVLLLVGSADAGKSTLTSALVQAGCDYLGDESIGIDVDSSGVIAYPKPLTLDGSSLRLLGLDPGLGPDVALRDVRPGAVALTGSDLPVSEVVVPTYVAGRAVAMATGLSPTEAIRAVLPNALNLLRAGQPGLASLCRLVERVPVTAVEHGDARSLATDLLAGRCRPQAGETVWGSSDVDDVRPHRHESVDAHEVELDGDRLRFVRRGTGRTVVLDPRGSSLWPRLDGTRTVVDLVEEIAGEAGADGGDVWSTVVRQVQGLVELGLVSPDDVGWPAVDAAAHPRGPWESTRSWSLARPMRRDSDEAWAARWVDLPHRTLWWGRVEVATDDDRVRAALAVALERGIAVEVAEGSAEDGPAPDDLVELRTSTGRARGAVLRIGGRELVSVAEGDEVEAVAAVLANRGDDTGGDHSAPIAPVWVRSEAGRAVLFVGTLPARHRRAADGDEGWVRRTGARIESGRVLRLLDADRATAWLRSGAAPDERSVIWRDLEILAIGVAGRSTPLDGWVTVADALATSRSTGPGSLGAVIGGASVPLVLGDGPDVGDRLEEALDRGRASQRPPGPASEEGTGGRPKDRASGSSDERLAALGELRSTDRSAKIDGRAIIVDRPLREVTFAPRRWTPGRPEPTVDDLRDVFAGLGLDPASAAEAAPIALDAGRFYLGEEWSSDDVWRRKVYVSGIAADRWERLADRWPDPLAAHVDPRPSWVAWKVSSQRPGQVERSVDVPFLAGAPSVASATDEMLGELPRPWADAVRALLLRIGVHAVDLPRSDDAVTVDEGGRRSVDLAVRQPRAVHGSLEEELRWLVSVAGHGDEAADELVSWVERHRLANVIFGRDASGEPFVNLYVAERSAPEVGAT
jgi:hypothetical protein